MYASFAVGVDRDFRDAPEVHGVVAALVLLRLALSWSRNWPLRENFRTCASLSVVAADPDVVHVVDGDAVRSTSASRSPRPGPPHELTTLPLASNSMTFGAGMQHAPVGVVLTGARLGFEVQRLLAVNDPDVVARVDRKRRSSSRAPSDSAAASARADRPRSAERRRAHRTGPPVRLRPPGAGGARRRRCRVVAGGE